ncbi:MAG: S41 family peptidase [Lachnospiraceae bacterium]|nr:S41 family peptidase [Lachnospiraceae bacterium]
MKNSFLKGMILGMAATALLFFGTYFIMGEIFDKAGKGLYESDEGTINLQAVVSSDEFVNKCKVLNNYINAYYINKKDISTDDICDGMYHGIIDSLGDKYADYYNSEEYNSFMENAQGRYGGIGTYVSKNAITGDIVIVNPFEGAPADKAGVKSGDILTAIDGESVVGLELDDIVTMMKGEEGTSASLGILRDGSTLTIEVVREMVDVPTVDYEVLEDGNIGYIYVSSFDSVTSDQFREAVDELEAKNVDGLIIDLRDNGGGLIDAVVDMLDRILPKGLVMYTETNKGRDEEFYSTDEESYTKPYAVIINGYSASASEVFAGAVQDYGFGTIVGTKSYGKGVVQSIFPLNGVNDGSAVKLTTAKYFTPNGRNIDGIGIEPDVVIEYDKNSTVDGGKFKIDNQIQKAIDVIKEKTGK